MGLYPKSAVKGSCNAGARAPRQGGKLVARTVATAGRQAKQLSPWRMRKRRQWKQEHMDFAVNLVINGEHANISSGQGGALSLQNACDKTHTKFPGCRIGKSSLGKWVASTRAGTGKRAKPGRPWGLLDGAKLSSIIPKEIVEVWVGHLGIKTEDQDCKLVKVAEHELLKMCANAGIKYPTHWNVDGLPRSFWQSLVHPEGYGYVDMRGRFTRSLDDARRYGENPDRLKRWYERIEPAIRSELKTRFAHTDEQVQEFFKDPTNFWHMDQKGMCVDPAEARLKPVALSFVWAQKSHQRSTGNRNWFTNTTWIRADGLVLNPVTIFEQGQIHAKCHEVCICFSFCFSCCLSATVFWGFSHTRSLAPACAQVTEGMKFATTKSGMSNASLHEEIVDEFIKQAKLKERCAAGKPSAIGYDNFLGNLGIAATRKLTAVGIPYTFASHSTRVMMANDNGALLWVSVCCSVCVCSKASFVFVLTHS